MGRGRRGEARTLNGALSQIVAFGIAAGLSPIPIVGVVLMLGTPRAKTNSLAFAGAWIASILIVGGAALAISSGAGGAGATTTESGTVVWKVVAGILLVAIGLRYWRKRPREGEALEVPKWMAAVDRFKAARAAALAVALSVVNPKNLVLVLGSAAAISDAALSTSDELLALAIFTAIATIGVATPIAIYFAMGERSAPVLARIKDWMIAKNSIVMLVICGLLGAYLIAEGLAG